MREPLLIAVVVACPLMMIWMMRGGHDHGGHAHGHAHDDGSRPPKSASQLRRERDELERLIEERESAKGDSTPLEAGRR